jgi:hypothetical protein
MDALHVLLISDSCFSGDILNITRNDRTFPDPSHIPFIKNSYTRTSRIVITSGALEPVPDKSEFSGQLKMCLKKNTHPFMDTLTLYNNIKLGVTLTFPLTGVLKATNHQEGGSFIFFLKDTDKTTLPGAIEITTGADGSLFINGKFKKNISRGTETLSNIDPGEYSLSIQYESGEEEIHSIIVEEGETAVITFSPITGQPSAKTKSRESLSYYTFSLGCGFPVPVFDTNQKMEIGFRPGFILGYSLKKNWGRLIFGFTSGLIVESLKEEYNGFFLYSLHAGGVTGYRSTFLDPFYVFVEASGGISVNIFVYDDESNNSTPAVPAPYIGPTLGIGIDTGPFMSFSVYGSFLFIFFSNELYTGITPGIRCKIKIR